MASLFIRSAMRAWPTIWVPSGMKTRSSLAPAPKSIGTTKMAATVAPAASTSSTTPPMISGTSMDFFACFRRRGPGSGSSPIGAPGSSYSCGGADGADRRAGVTAAAGPAGM